MGDDREFELVRISDLIAIPNMMLQYPFVPGAP